MTAYCYRSGQIRFQSDKRKLPSGAISLGRHPRIRRFVEPIARLAHDNKTLLVPGVPEADSENAAYNALLKFSEAVDVRRAKADREKVTR